MKQRSIGMMILLLIITVGIYGIYWYIAFQMEIKRNTSQGAGGFVHLLLTIFTFGIYYLYWNYVTGQRLKLLGLNDNGVLYLLLAIFGFGWLNLFLMQSEANKVAVA